jgi:hypothetical protein
MLAMVSQAKLDLVLTAGCNLTTPYHLHILISKKSTVSQTTNPFFAKVDPAAYWPLGTIWRRDYLRRLPDPGISLRDYLPPWAPVVKEWALVVKNLSLQ